MFAAVMLPNCWPLRYRIANELPNRLAHRGARIRNSITGQVGFLFYRQSFLDRFFSLALMFMSFDSLTPAELPVSPGRFRVIARRYPNKPCGTRLSLPGTAHRVLPNLGGVETWNLDQNPIAPDRTDYRFADSKT